MDTQAEVKVGTRSIGHRYFVRVNDSELWNEQCGRCGGEGYLRGYEHIDNGRCYECWGNPVIGRFTTAELDKKLKQRNQREARKEAKRLAVCAERDARVARLEAEQPAVAALLAAAYGDYQNDEGKHSSFVVQLAEQVHNAKGRDLSEKQVQAVLNILGRNEVRALEAAAQEYLPAELGTKVTVEGDVLFTKKIEGQYGTSLLIVVRVDETHKVKMFTTAAWAWDLPEGNPRVEVTGTVKAHEEYNGEKATQLVRVKGVTL